METDDGPGDSLIRRWYRGWYKWVLAWLTTLSTPGQPIVALVLVLVTDRGVITDASVLLSGVASQLIYLAAVVLIGTAIVRRIREWRRDDGQPPEADAAAES